MRGIKTYSGQPITTLAMRFTANVFQRPGEVRQAEWSEIDFDAAAWTIPAARMKQRQPQRVPLSRQALEILREAAALSANSKYVFPKLGSPFKPVCENAINGALRRMGFGADVMTAHGFRSSASSLLNESGKWNPDTIERALAHADANQVRAAYHRGAHWAERAEVAEWWSDQLNTLRDGAVIIPLLGVSRKPADVYRTNIRLWVYFVEKVRARNFRALRRRDRIRFAPSLNRSCALEVFRV